jgi:hypothetical protein
VLRIWHAFGLQPWRTEDFKISPDPLLTDKIRDVIGLYLAPPANTAVFAVDEKPQIQALKRTAPDSRRPLGPLGPPTPRPVVITPRLPCRRAPTPVGWPETSDLEGHPNISGSPCASARTWTWVGSRSVIVRGDQNPSRAPTASLRADP